MYTVALPYYLSVGVTEERFWDGTPKDLEPYVLAYQHKQEYEDTMAWTQGIYFLSAIQTALDRAFNGAKSKAEYLKQPFSKEIEERKKFDRPLTEEEKEYYTKQLFMRLEIMQHNFEMNKQHNEG